MKKISLLIVAVLLAVQSALVSGCSEKNDAAKDQRLSGAEAQWAEGITLEDYLEKVPYIFTGVCTEVRTGKPSGLKQKPEEIRLFFRKADIPQSDLQKIAA